MWAQARWARSGWIAAPLGRFAHAPCDRLRGGALVLLAFLRAMVPAQGHGPRAFIAQLYATRFAPLYGEYGEYGETANLTREGGGGAAVAAEGGEAGKAGGSLDQIAACLIAPPREGAPEADGALRAAIAAAAVCQQVDTLRPGKATALAAPRVTRALGTGLPSTLRNSAPAAWPPREGGRPGGRSLICDHDRPSVPSGVAAHRARSEQRPLVRTGRGECARGGLRRGDGGLAGRRRDRAAAAAPLEHST